MLAPTLRPAAATDANPIASLHAESWRDAYASILDPAFLAGPIEADRIHLWSGRLLDPCPGQVVHLAEDEAGQIVGFICAYRDVDANWGSLVDNLHVTPRLRGKGLGKVLIRKAASLLAELGASGGLHLWVFEANRAGLRFYERLGGKVVGQDVSQLPAADGQMLLRVHWDTLVSVGEQHAA